MKLCKKAGLAKCAEDRVETIQHAKIVILLFAVIFGIFYYWYYNSYFILASNCKGFVFLKLYIVAVCSAIYITFENLPDLLENNRKVRVYERFLQRKKSFYQHKIYKKLLTLLLVLFSILSFLCGIKSICCFLNFVENKYYEIKENIKVEYLIRIKKQKYDIFMNRKFISKKSYNPDKSILKYYNNPKVFNIETKIWHELNCEWSLKCTDNCVYMEYSELEKLDKLKISRECYICKKNEEEKLNYAEEKCSEKYDSGDPDFEDCVGYYMEQDDDDKEDDNEDEDEFNDNSDNYSYEDGFNAED